MQSRSRPFLLLGHRQTAAKQRRVNWMVPGSWLPVSNSPKVHEKSISFREGTSFFAAYDTGKGELLGTGGGTYVLNGSSYTEHVDFGDRISAGVVGKDQQFGVKIDGDTFVQAGNLSNGKSLSETWKRVN